MLNSDKKVMNVAKALVYYSFKQGVPINNLRLNKLLYLLQIECLKNRGYLIFSDEFVAWDLGPIMPIVYKKYCLYGASNIYPYDIDINIDDESDIYFIKKIIDVYKNKTNFELCDITKETLPWEYTYHMFGKHNRIKNAYLRQCYLNFKKG